MRGLQQDGSYVPAALVVADQVEAGLIEANAADFEASAPEGSQADVGVDARGAECRFGSEGGVFFDQKVGQFKAGTRGAGGGLPMKGARGGRGCCR